MFVVRTLVLALVEEDSCPHYEWTHGYVNYPALLMPDGTLRERLKAGLLYSMASTEEVTRV
ncbi:MAG: hypothetical protein KME57_36090 [Scytonema hyalinum WJT4-NPBG1]|nr:hypothetical protein [Scytonema hyalinum WJT4-NPBG1]